MKRIGLVFIVVFALYASSVFAAQSEYYTPKPDGKYDNNTYLVDPEKYSLNHLKNSTVRLESTTDFEGPGGKTASNTRTGGGIIIGKYILTVAHVVMQENLVVTSPFGYIEVPAKKLGDKTVALLDGAKIVLTAVYLKKEDDLAIFKLPDGISVSPFPYEIGNSDDLEIGNAVYLVGNPLGVGINVRPGMVSATEAPKETEGVDGKSKNFFVLSGGLYKGDSGSPIIAIRDGKFELVGIAEGVFSGSSQLGFAIRINVVKKVIGDCKECPDDLKNIFVKKKTR